MIRNPARHSVDSHGTGRVTGHVTGRSTGRGNRPMGRALALLLGCTAMLGACSTQAAQQAAAPVQANEAALHPVSGLEIAPLTVEAGGQVHHFRVEIARTAQDQARGLMFRTEMGPDEGMLFPRARAEPASFWMKNTVLSLDIIYIGPDRRVLNVAANTVPYSLDPILSDGPVIAVLELNAGRAAQLAIGPGSLVSW